MPSRRTRVRPRNFHSRRSAVIGPGLAAVAASAGLLSAAAPAGAETAAQAAQLPLLSEGASGPAVATIQHALHVAASGHFSARTRHAVMSFQRRHHLLVDGIVGPQTRDALFGIKAPAAPSTGTATATTGSAGYSIPSGIVQCESGGNYSAVNPQTGAGGAYQIIPSTWQAYGGQGLPQDAPKSEQDAIAAKIYAGQGPSAWTC